MVKPIIGVSTYREAASWATWEGVEAALLPADYLRSVREGGGIPVLVPPLDTPGDAPTLVARIDGLVIAGGPDLNPALYSERPQPATHDWQDGRDTWETALLDAADAVGLPVLGICRGMQLIAVRAGGRLRQHVPEVVGDDRHCPGPGAYGSTQVDTVAGTRLARLLGRHLTAHCHHHQAVLEHPGYLVSAYAPDGTVEAIEVPGARCVLGVQWHPEAGVDSAVFGALVDAARLRVLP